MTLTGVKGQGHSRPSKWQRHPCWLWDIKVYLLVVAFCLEADYMW